LYGDKIGTLLSIDAEEAQKRCKMDKVNGWKPILDLPDNWRDLVDDNVSELFDIWLKKVEIQKESESLKQFNEKIKRRWAIEIGIIEELYYIGRGTTKILSEEGIDPELIPCGSTDRKPEEIIPILIGHENAMERIYNFLSENRELNVADVRELHKILTEYQYLEDKEPDLIENEVKPEIQEESLESPESTEGNENAEVAPGESEEVEKKEVSPGGTGGVENEEVAAEESKNAEEEKFEEVETVREEIDEAGEEKEFKTEEIIRLRKYERALSKLVEGKNVPGDDLPMKGPGGEWRTEIVAPTGTNGSTLEYCPPDKIQSEMVKLLKMHQEHIEKHVHPQVEAAWLHHNLMRIRPFFHGNHRVALCLASLVFIRANWFPLIIYRNSRYAYMDALERADRKDLSYLVSLFAKMQKKSLTSDPGLTEDVLDRHKKIKKIIASAAKKITKKLSVDKSKFANVFGYADRLKEIAFNELNETAELITGQLSAICLNYFAGVRGSDLSNNYYFLPQIFASAEKLDYYPNTREYREWCRLHIVEDRHNHIVVSFHGFGRNFNGIMAASAFSYEREEDEDGERKNINVHKICGELFKFSYDEDFLEIELKFKYWLNNTISAGLEYWKEEL